MVKGLAAETADKVEPPPQWSNACNGQIMVNCQLIVKAVTAEAATKVEPPRSGQTRVMVRGV